MRLPKQRGKLPKQNRNEKRNVYRKCRYLRAKRENGDFFTTMAESAAATCLDAIRLSFST